VVIRHQNRHPPTETIDGSWIIANRYVPELTCEQRKQYHVEPLCDEAGAEPR
jgi:hypothetical protein